MAIPEGPHQPLVGRESGTLKKFTGFEVGLH